MRIVGTFLLVVVLVQAAGLATYFSVAESHPLREFLVDEDKLIECLSAATFFLAFLGGAALLFRGVRRHVDRRWLMLVTVLGLAGFLDELSYGERIFGLKMPRIAKIKLDAAHDVIDWLYYEGPVVVARHRGLCLLGLVVAVVLISFGLIRVRHRLRDLACDRGNYPLYALLAFFVAFLACAVTIDLGILDPWSTQLPIVEELLELCAGIALVFAACTVYRNREGAGIQDDGA